MILALKYYVQKITIDANQIISNATQVTGTVTDASERKKTRNSSDYRADFIINHSEKKFTCNTSISKADYVAFHAGELKTLNIYFRSEDSECWNIRTTNLVASRGVAEQWLIAVFSGIMASLLLYVVIAILPIKKLRKLLT